MNPIAPDGPFSVKLDTHPGVAVLTLHGTADGNDMGARVWSGLPELVTALAGDAAVRAVVVHGSGDCFSAGLDLRWYLTHYRRMTRDGDGLRPRLLTEAGHMQAALSAIAGSRLPFIATVHGPGGPDDCRYRSGRSPWCWPGARTGRGRRRLWVRVRPKSLQRKDKNTSW